MTFFTHGGVQYPLTASTSNDLLQDADPALFYMIEYVATVLEKHIGPRLVAQAAGEGLNLQRAVSQTLHVQPSPELLADQFKFPALAIYRMSEVYKDLTVSWPHDVSEWEYVYVLPPLQPKALKALQPILRAAATVIRHAIRARSDSAWRNEANLWELANIERAGVTTVRYGGLESAREIPDFYRAIIGTIQVAEREMPDTRVGPLYEGADTVLDHRSPDGTVLADLVQTSSQLPPTVTAISPSSGSKAGGTTLLVTGTGFRVPMRVVVDNVDCLDVEVLSATQASGETRPHAAFPTFTSDVFVETDNGQSAPLVAGYTYTTP